MRPGIISINVWQHADLVEITMLQSGTTAGLSRVAYGTDEAADAAGFGRNVIVDAMNAGTLPARKYGRRTVILHDDLVDWLRSLPPRDPENNAAAKRAAEASVRAARRRRAASEQAAVA